MATTSIKQLESFDSGSNYNFADKMLKANAARSMFDESHQQIGTMCENGVLQVLDVIPTVPSDSFDIWITELLRALPTVIPLESRQRQYIYAFWNRLGDLWNNFETFMKKGYSGNVIKKIPPLEKEVNTYPNANNVWSGSAAQGHPARIMYERATGATSIEGYNTTWETIDSILSGSMGECMGLPHNYHKETKTIDGVSVTKFANKSDHNVFIKGTGKNNIEEISALPFMMLLRVWRDYFTNKNWWINDRVILPDCDQDFRLNDAGELISAKNEGAKWFFDISTRGRDIEVGYETVGGVQQKRYIMGLPYHEWPKDRWTSALPFLQRGDTPTLNADVTYTTQDLPIKSGIGQLKLQSQIGWDRGGGLSTLGGITLAGINAQPTIDGSYSTANVAALSDSMAVLSADASGLGVQVKIDMAKLRALAIEQTELERAARTDGSYAEWGLAFFSTVSKNAIDHKPVYIGGSYKEIKYTEVVQTSQSDITPMGSYTGHSTSGITDEYIGHIDCDDYGYIMIISCIMPDVLYSEGLADHWTNLLQSQFYMPDRAKLGMTNLINKTIYFDYSNTATAKTYNNGLFAYQNIADDYRYLPSQIRGKIADGWNDSFFSYTQSRIMGNQVNWGREFGLASRNNVRNDYLTAPKEPPFTYDMNIRIRAVRPIPYKPVPANLTGL